MSIVLAHEIAHTLGLKEVYANSYGDNLRHDGEDGMTCIMECTDSSNDRVLAIKNHYLNVVSGSTSALCDYCKTKLFANIPDDVYEEIEG